MTDTCKHCGRCPTCGQNVKDNKNVSPIDYPVRRLGDYYPYPWWGIVPPYYPYYDTWVGDQVPNPYQVTCTSTTTEVK